MSATSRRGLLFGLLAAPVAIPPIIEAVLAAPPVIAEAYTHTSFGLGYAVTREVLEDNLYPWVNSGFVDVLPSVVALQAREIVARNILEGAGFHASVDQLVP